MKRAKDKKGFWGHFVPSFAEAFVCTFTAYLVKSLLFWEGIVPYSVAADAAIFAAVFLCVCLAIRLVSRYVIHHEEGEKI